MGKFANGAHLRRPIIARRLAHHNTLYTFNMVRQGLEDELQAVSSAYAVTNKLLFSRPNLYTVDGGRRRSRAGRGGNQRSHHHEVFHLEQDLTLLCKTITTPWSLVTECSGEMQFGTNVSISITIPLLLTMQTIG